MHGGDRGGEPRPQDGPHRGGPADAGGRGAHPVQLLRARDPRAHHLPQRPQARPHASRLSLHAHMSMRLMMLLLQHNRSCWRGWTWLTGHWSSGEETCSTCCQGMGMSTMFSCRVRAAQDLAQHPVPRAHVRVQQPAQLPVEGAGLPHVLPGRHRALTRPLYSHKDAMPSHLRLLRWATRCRKQFSKRVNGQANGCVVSLAVAGQRNTLQEAEGSSV